MVQCSYGELQDAASVLELFDKVRPNSGTPIGDRLEYLLNKIIEEAETRKTKGTLKDLKPTSIIVITDGEASMSPICFVLHICSLMYL